MTLPHAARACSATASLLVPLLAWGAEPSPWDQQKVTEYAETFATQMNDLYRGITRKQTGAQVGSGQAASYLRFKDNLRLGTNEARYLQRALKDGKSREETYAAFARLMTIVRNARDEARRMFHEQSTLDQITAARETLRKLAPYYDPDLESQLQGSRPESGSGGSSSP